MPSGSTTTQPANAPVIGSVLFGGSLSGALVRDVRLANELVERGYPVHVWWVMDRQKAARLDPRITQHWLFHGLRFRGWPPRQLWEAAGRWLNALFDDTSRAHAAQKRTPIVTRIMQNQMRCLCEGVSRADQPLVQRFARDLDRTGVTHVLPMLEMLAPWIDAARQQVARPVKYLVTFQGYELYSTYARAIGLERELYDRLAETVARSDWPAIAVSADYLERVIEDMNIPRSSLVAIPPGVPSAQPMPRAHAVDVLRTKFKEYREDLPLIAYLGRRDAEKGIDLLLYAAAILRRRGVSFQLAICGPSLWGDHYGKVCQQIAEELRGPVMWRRFVPDDVRTALFSLARAIIYPSIHREPFGMVAAEAAAHGAPAIVPDYGGVASAIEAQGHVAGLRFKAWDSGDLAATIQRLLQDDALHQRLSQAGPHVAAHFSIPNMADRVLTHIGLPLRAQT